MDGFRERIESLKDELAQSAGNDPLYDRFRSGAIQAYFDLLNVDVEETVDEN